MKKTILIMPAYNEEKTIGSVLDKVKKYKDKGVVDKILVVDDGSIDKTVEIVKNKGLDVVCHVINRGYGAAQRTGHEIAIRENYTYIIQMDADGQHDPKYIKPLLDQIKNYDIVLGSRFLKKNNTEISFMRKLGIKFFSLLVRLVGGTRITDVTSGLKVYRVSMLKQLTRHSDKNPAVEQMLEISKKGFKIKEISVGMKNRKSGKSHLDFKRFIFYPFRAIYLMIKVILFR